MYPTEIIQKKEKNENAHCIFFFYNIRSNLNTLKNVEQLKLYASTRCSTLWPFQITISVKNNRNVLV